MTGAGPVPPGVEAVTGGVGGTTAHLADLRALSRLCARTAEDLTAGAWRSRGVCADPDLLLSAVLCPVTAAEAERSVLACVAGPQGALVVGAAIAGVAALVEAAAWTYEQAERAVADLWQGLDFGAGLAVGLAAPATAGGAGVAFGLLWLRLQRDPDLARSFGQLLHRGHLDGPLQRLLTDETALVQHAVDGGGGVLSGVLVWAGPVTSTVLGGRGAPLTTAQAAADLALYFVDGTAQVRAGTGWAPLPPGTPGADTGGVTGLLSGLQGTASAGAGQVDIRRVTTRRRDGTSSVAYVVDVPGTDDWSLPPRQWSSDTARDLGADLRLVAGETTAHERGIVLALARAGVPPGATVALVGHSQGGMAAMAVAADPAVRARYHVTHVVTAGAPVARMPHPTGVQVLSLENSGDLVPMLEGADNPDRADHVTVRFADNRHLVGANHDLQRYVEGAASVDRCDDPSVRRVVESLRDAGVLAPDGARTTVESSSWVVTAGRPAA